MAIPAKWIVIQVLDKSQESSTFMKENTTEHTNGQGDVSVSDNDKVILYNAEMTTKTTTSIDPAFRRF